MNKVKLAALSLLFSFLFVLYGSNSVHASPLSWPLQTNGIFTQGLGAMDTDNINMLDCSSPPATHIFEHFENNESTSFPTIQYDQSRVSCIGAEDTYSKTAIDGTAYVNYTPTVNGQLQSKIAAIKNGEMLWSTSTMSNAVCSEAGGSQVMLPYSTSIGSDGNIYVILMPSVSGSNCATYIAAYDYHDGHQIFKQYLASMNNYYGITIWAWGKIWTYDNKIVLVDADGKYREFSYGGVENTSKQYQFPDVTATSVTKLLANADGRVFAVYDTPWGCGGTNEPTGTYVYYHDSDGTSGITSFSYGCPSSPTVKYRTAAGGNIVGYRSNTVYIAHTADSSYHGDAFSPPSGYTQSKIFGYWEDTSGKGLLLRQLTDSNGDNTISIDYVNWSTSAITNQATIQSTGSGDDPTLIDMPSVGDIAGGYLYLPVCHASCNTGSGITSNTSIHKVALSSFGTPMKDISSLATRSVPDQDNDGLNYLQERDQETSDLIKDTDGDGLSDFIESEELPNRDDIFCDKNTNPYTCAYPDPLKKDIYVEIDWMKNGSTEYKPNSTQLGYVQDGLGDLDYNVHIDHGQYGGGNELPTYVQYLPFTYNATPVGFFDLKNGNPSQSVAANFSTNRHGVWRYMIAGYGYDEVHSSSGASYAGSDNIFVSVGRIQDNQTGFGYGDLNTAIAGTMVHELGHSLCMSEDQSYSYQSLNCRYSGVDNFVATTYDSVLNYNLQMFQNSLSDGGNETGDHDDWGAINDGGVADFSRWDASEADFEPGKIHHGLTEEQAQEAMKTGAYGKVEKDGKIYDLKERKVYDKRDGKVYNVDEDGSQADLSDNQQQWAQKLTTEKVISEELSFKSNPFIWVGGIAFLVVSTGGGIIWYIRKKR